MAGGLESWQKVKSYNKGQVHEIRKKFGGYDILQVVCSKFLLHIVSFTIHNCSHNLSQCTYHFRLSSKISSIP